jgi:hypothetical protein
MIIKFCTFAVLAVMILSCVPGSESDNYDDLSIDHFPLAEGNKWVYSVTRGSEFYTDSAEIIGRGLYPVDDVVNRELFRFKQIAFTKEMLELDTVYVRLLEYDSEKLMFYGSEKRDRSLSNFIYDDPVMLDPPGVLLDHITTNLAVLYNSENFRVEAINAEKFYIKKLIVDFSGAKVTLTDTTVNCIKTRSILYSGSSSETNYDLLCYHTNYGILKMEGYVNGIAFKANATKIKLN